MKQQVALSLSLRWLLLLSLIVFQSQATLFHVGGPVGWTLPPPPYPSHFYKHWASNKNFTVGDILEFKSSGPGSLQNVKKHDYRRCNSSHPLWNFRDEITEFGLLEPGHSYFISSDIEACEKGQRMALRVFPFPRRPSPPPGAGALGSPIP